MEDNKMYNGIKLDALEAIKETLEEGYTESWDDFHNEVFNKDYYVYSDREAMTHFRNAENVFWAIDKVRQYENNRYGEYYTDYTSPMKIVNMLSYIAGDEIFYDEMESWDVINDETDNNVITEELLKRVGKLSLEYIFNMEIN